MTCPVCTTDLRITERSGVEIDYCPRCRGVGLDRGEIEKLIDRSAALAGNAQPDIYRRRQYEVASEDYRHGGKKKKSFLGDLFDFT